VSSHGLIDPVPTNSQRALKSEILLVDDHPLIRDAITRLIATQPDLACAGVADNTSDAKRLVEQSAPDLIILDLRLKNGNALDLIKTLRLEHTDVKVLVFSQYDELSFAERALRAGASGYLMKENGADELLRAMRKVLSGDIYYSERVGATLVRQSLEHKPEPSANGVGRLSDRELQVLQLISASYSTRQIAQELNLSIKTVESHRENIKSKLNLQNAAELYRFAQDWAAKNLLPFAPEAERPGRHNRKR
jgi:DNA-binding NarL/FixJ family response regulator